MFNFVKITEFRLQFQKQKWISNLKSQSEITRF